MRAEARNVVRRRCNADLRCPARGPSHAIILNRLQTDLLTDTMTDKRRLLVTAALPYANGSIHMGHMLEYIQTDIWVRFQKLRGHQCIYVCADDAHGSAIMLRAEKEGITPEQLIDAEHDGRAKIGRAHV